MNQKELAWVKFDLNQPWKKELLHFCRTVCKAGRNMAPISSFHVWMHTYAHPSAQTWTPQSWGQCTQCTPFHFPDGERDSQFESSLSKSYSFMCKYLWPSWPVFFLNIADSSELRAGSEEGHSLSSFFCSLLHHYSSVAYHVPGPTDEAFMCNWLPLFLSPSCLVLALPSTHHQVNEFHQSKLGWVWRASITSSESYQMIHTFVQRNNGYFLSRMSL